MRPNEGRPRRARRSKATERGPRHRAVRGALAAIGTTLATAVGALAGVTRPPMLAASFAAAAFAFAACWLGVLGTAHVLARLIARR